MTTFLRAMVVTCLLAVLVEPHQRAHAENPLPVFPIGAAKIDITPDYPIRLTGYAARKTECEGVAQRIWAKAVAIGDDRGPGPAVLITVENCGMTPEVRT